VAVVAHANEGGAASLDVDGDARRARVERVLDELFDDARGTLDDLAGGDLVRELVAQLVDARGRLQATGSRLEASGSRNPSRRRLRRKAKRTD